MKDIIQWIKNFFKALFGTETDSNDTTNYDSDIDFQTDEGIVCMLTSSCSINEEIKYVHYSTIQEAHANHLMDIKTWSTYPGQGVQKPYWDMRYVNEIERYQGTINNGKYTGLDTRDGVDNITIGTSASRGDASGSVIQAECINGQLAGGVMINLFDAPEQALEYSGPQATLCYRLGANEFTKPWHANGGNLMMQANFDTPIYVNYANNSGGSSCFGLFLRNAKLNKHLNFVIGTYSYGHAWTEEQDKLHFDTTTKTVHIATVVKPDTKWSTKSPLSASTTFVPSTPGKTNPDNGTWDNFFRVNITHANLMNVLNEIKKKAPHEVAGQDFGLSPEDWDVASIMVQYELEESGGKATVSGSFHGFEIYTSELPL